MRVITGCARGRRLLALEGEDVTRPTSEKVKEGLFSAIQFHVAGAEVLDLFAGSGQLGIEALSREAKLCVFVDKSRAASEVVIANLKSTGLFSKSRVITADAASYLARCKDKYDIIFLDPPYASDALEEILPLVPGVANDGALVVCETDLKRGLPEEFGALKVKKRYKYGKTAVVIYSKDEEGDDR